MVSLAAPVWCVCGADLAAGPGWRSRAEEPGTEEAVWWAGAGELPEQSLFDIHSS